MIHINLAKRKQNIKPKANGNNTVYQPLGSSYNFCTISKENMKKILPNNNKSKNHFRHISITTGIKVNNNLEELIFIQMLPNSILYGHLIIEVQLTINMVRRTAHLHKILRD